MLALEGHTAPVYALAFSPNGRFLASGDKNGTLQIWDESLASKKLFFATDGRDAPTPVNALCWDSSSSQLAVAMGNGSAVLDLRPDGSHVFTWEHLTGATAVQFLTGNLLAVGVGDRGKPEPGQLELWDIFFKKRREPTHSAMNGVRAVAAHPPSQRVAWAEWGGVRHPGPRMFVWDITKQDKHRYGLPHKAVSLAFHPDGHLLAAAIDREVRIFDLARKQERFRMRGHKGIVSCVAASPDGRSIASGSWDDTVRVWDWTTGTETACFQWSIGKVSALAYSADGLRLAAAGDEGRIMMWDMA